MKYLIELRAAEGGDHSALLVKQQVSMYAKFCEKHHLI